MATAPVCQPLWLSDLQGAAPPVADWLWQGYLKPGHVTLLTSPWKSGKTTLTAVLLARLQHGGSLAGRAVATGKAVIVSEEGPELWRQRAHHFGLGSNVCWLCRPFVGKPTFAQWLRLLDQLRALHEEFGLALVIVDPLGPMLPGPTENDASLMLEALVPLQRLTDAGLAVLLLHHPRKATSADGQAARGSGALSAFADILIEKRYYRPASSDDRRRILLAFSRFDATPRRLVIELNEAGTDYVALGDLEDVEFRGNWKSLRQVLTDARRKLTQAEIRSAWLTDEDTPSRPTLSRWLQRAVLQGLVQRDGSGRINDPYRYWLKEQEEEWRRDPLGEAQQQANLDRVRQVLEQFQL